MKWLMRKVDLYEQSPPWWWGAAYEDVARRQLIYYPIGINFIVAGLRWCRDFICYPHWTVISEGDYLRQLLKIERIKNRALEKELRFTRRLYND